MAPPPPTRRQLIADSAQTATRPTVHQGEASTLAVSSLDFQHPVDPGSAANTNLRFRTADTAACDQRFGG
jgi:hypothetical protein